MTLVPLAQLGVCQTHPNGDSAVGEVRSNDTASTAALGGGAETGEHSHGDGLRVRAVFSPIFFKG